MIMPRTFRARILLAALLPAVLIAIALATIFSMRQLDSLEQALAARAQAEARQLADAADFGIFSGNRNLLERLTRNISQSDPDITAATIIDAKGSLLARNGKSALDSLPQPQGKEGSVVVGETLIVHMPIRAEPLDVADIYSGEAVTPGGGLVGMVVLEFSTKRMRQEQGRLVALGTAVTILGLLFGGMLATRIALGVARPVQRMSEVVRRIAAGDLAARVTPEPMGPVRVLEDGINEMADRIATNQEHLQARIAEATAELRSRKDEAESATAAKSRFLAAASHDLRQPMHALGLFVSRLGMLQLSHEAHGVVRHIEASVSTLEDLLDALLDVSRIDAGLVVPKLDIVPTDRLFERIAHDLRETARRQGLAFRHRTPAKLCLLTDPVLVERILGNLIGNALRYTQRGGVLLACRRRGLRARIEVWDTGIGIPETSQQVIFEEYMQLANPERDRTKGLGLGLAICSRLARLLDTRVQVRSVPGRGSVFFFEVPLVEMPIPDAAADAAATARDEAATAAARGRLSGTVVIVDDDELVLASTAELVAAWGCRVVAGTSVTDVMAELTASALQPDAAIFDYRLRGFENGLHSARALQNRHGNIPVMLLTGNLTEPLKREAAKYGFALLSKPLKPARLRALLQHMLAPAVD